MDVVYKINEPVTAQQFIELLNASTLGERRPVEDIECIQGMLDHANLTVTAWQEDKNGNVKLVGISRSVTDFHYACYLSDLAVDKTKQSMGIGKELQRITQKQLGPKCKLILLAAPKANEYYKKIGFTHNPRCWILEPEQSIN